MNRTQTDPTRTIGTAARTPQRAPRRAEPPVVTYVQAPGVSEEEANAIMDEIYAYFLDPTDEEWARMNHLAWPPREEGQRQQEATARPEQSAVAS